MESEPHKLITLDFLREDGKHEISKLIYYSLNQARNTADLVFRNSDVRYIDVKICADDHNEILSNLYPATVEDLWRI